MIGVVPYMGKPFPYAIKGNRQLRTPFYGPEWKAKNRTSITQSAIELNRSQVRIHFPSSASGVPFIPLLHGGKIPG